MISYVKYPNFPIGNTPDPHGGRDDPLPHLPQHRASNPRPGHRSACPPNFEHKLAPMVITQKDIVVCWG